MTRLCVVFILAISQLFAADTTLQSRNQAYRLQPSDQLQLTYRYTPEYNQSLTVQPDGVVVVELVGPVHVAGLTIEQAQAALVARLSTRLNQPEISLLLSDFVRPTYTVLGEVGAPGRFELRGTVTTLDAMAAAGGLKSSAKHSQVVLFRREAGDMASTHILDLKKMMDVHHPNLREDIVLKPGDLLIVPKNRVSKIADYVHWVSVGSYVPM
ncbi:MAG TPA: polysaccharide biosynthesis/export family protein [Granulicella sp.]|jgi:polysaccharide export outer membrane protein|nr:polysaccharide biosynthesis/export family protein [Granulicella sp.]